MANYTVLHDWAMQPKDAVQLQHELRDRVLLRPLDREVKTIAGADISFDKYSPTLFAGIVVLALPSLDVVEEAGVEAKVQFPYVPGLLSFREIPPLLEAWRRLRTTPDAIMLDGQGIAHPRRFGIACHMGLVAGVPSFGCAKSVLVGTYEEPAPERGAWTPMVHRRETVGAALRTKPRVRPVYVSPGHLIDLQDSIRLALACNGGYRQPEPTRLAHHFVNAMRRGERRPAARRVSFPR